MPESKAPRSSLPFRTLNDANHLRRRMTAALDRFQPDSAPQDTRSALTFAVVGGGASGVELSTKMAALLRDAVKRRALHGEPRVLMIEMADRLVPGMGEEIREVRRTCPGEYRVEASYRNSRCPGYGRHDITLEHKNELPK